MTDLNALAFCRVPLSQIDREFRLTDFSLSSPNVSLERSIREIGVTHPLLLVRRNAGYGIISGHRRFRVGEGLSLSVLPARVLNDLDEADMLETNLIENTAHRQYSDVEKSLILQKAITAGIPEYQVVDRIMPLLGLERSKKNCAELLRTGSLRAGLRLLLHELNVPLRYFSVCLRWDEDSRNAVEALFAQLRPGINKWRDMLDLLDETARREQVTAAKLLSRPEIKTIWEAENLSSHEKYDRIFHEVYRWRHPTLSDMKKRALLALDKLRLDGKIKMRTAENFENGEIKVEIKVTSQADLKRCAEQLSGAADSEALAELIRICKGKA